VNLRSTNTTAPAPRAHLPHRPLELTRAALALLLLAIVPAALAGDGQRAPDLGDCEEVAVPAGNKVSFHAYAQGVQIYRWNGTSWDFVAPDATLYTDGDAGQDGIVGTHYVGPTWESTSGSKVTATVDVRCPVGPSNIPWLRLKAATHPGNGVFDRVTYVQRINTAGGVAPATPGQTVGEEARVPYTADYYFYRAQ
jgi:hypothetical protein